MEKIIKIEGREFDLSKINNPKLKRIVQNRGFMFSYSDQYHQYCDDGSSYGDESSKVHTDDNHHSDHHLDAPSYSERAEHTDVNAPGLRYAQRHKDYTDQRHTDHKETYGDHTDNF